MKLLIKYIYKNKNKSNKYVSIVIFIDIKVQMFAKLYISLTM